MNNLLKISAWLLVIVGCALFFGVSAQASYLPVWPESKVKDFSFIKKDNLWYIIAINAPNTPPPSGQPESAGLPVSTSYDLEHWTNRGIAIPVGRPGSWDDYAIWAPTIIQSGHTYYLYYTGVHMVGTTPVQKIGLATSTDLIHWTKSSANPMVDCSQLSWNYWNTNNAWYGADCRDPFVTRDEINHRWVMFFTARMPHNSDPLYQSLPYPAVIGMAVSTDLRTWSDAGFIPATLGPTAESAHVIQHSGTSYLVYTNDCQFRGAIKCLVYSTAPALTGPYTGYDNLPFVHRFDFASEYYQDLDGTEYFGRTDGDVISFSYVNWSGNAFAIRSIPSATFTGAVWNDVNRNGLVDAGETGVNGITIRAFLDNGDGQFDPGRDFLLSTVVTTNGLYNATTMAGTYTFTSIQPGKIWIAVGAENIRSGSPLAGRLPSFGSTVWSYTVTRTEAVITPGFGFSLPVKQSLPR